MRLTILFLICLFSISETTAQFEKRDSLLRLVSTARKDSAAVKLYLEIGHLYEDNDPVMALLYFRKSAELCNEIDYSSGTLKTMRSLANVFRIQGQFDSTLYYYRNALLFSEKNSDSLNIGLSLFNLGSTYRAMTKLDSALHYCLQGAKIIESFGDKAVQAKMNNGMQLLYYYLPNYEKAISYGEKAVQQAREVKDDNLLLQSLSNLSMSYKDLQQLDRSISVLTEALKLAEKAGDVYSRSAILLNLGGVYLEKKDYTLLRKYALISLDLHREIGAKDGECASLRGLAISYLQQGNYPQAKEYATKAYEIADSNNYKLEKASCLKTLSNISYAMQDLKQGEIYFNESDDMVESLFKETYLQSAAEFEKKYESDKKDNKLKLQQAELQRKSFLNTMLIVAGVTLLLLLLLSYRNYSQKQIIQQQRINELETEKKLNATEAVLKGEEQERTRLAKDLHDGLGGMLSGIKYSFQTMKGNLIMTPDNQQAFERSMDMLDSSIKEMRRVAHNMMPEALVKFGLDTALKDFCNDINQNGIVKIDYQSIDMESAGIDQTTAINIYRIVQELVNNILKHASAKSVFLQVTNTNGQLSVTVEDDGKGFDTSILSLEKGMGWNNIQSRIKFLNGKIDVQSDAGKGTSIHFELNIV
jgi:two-component system, NarL family, sensor kinase